MGHTYGPFTPSVGINAEMMQAIVISSKLMTRNGVALKWSSTHSEATLLSSMRPISLGSSQHWLCVDADAQRKKALNSGMIDPYKIKISNIAQQGLILMGMTWTLVCVDIVTSQKQEHLANYNYTASLLVKTVMKNFRLQRNFKRFWTTYTYLCMKWFSSRYWQPFAILRARPTRSSIVNLVGWPWNIFKTRH